MKRTGFYIIKDKFFKDMSDPYLKGNKAGNRPHYYCFEDASTGDVETWSEIYSNATRCHDYIGEVEIGQRERVLG